MVDLLPLYKYCFFQEATFLSNLTLYKMWEMLPRYVVGKLSTPNKYGQSIHTFHLLYQNYLTLLQGDFYLDTRSKKINTHFKHLNCFTLALLASILSPLCLTLKPQMKPSCIAPEMKQLTNSITKQNDKEKEDVLPQVYVAF